MTLPLSHCSSKIPSRALANDHLLRVEDVFVRDSGSRKEIVRERENSGEFVCWQHPATIVAPVRRRCVQLTPDSQAATESLRTFDTRPSSTGVPSHLQREAHAAR
jgi:hypothetical protein